MKKPSAAEEAQPLLEEINKNFGFIPNLAKEMSISPQTLELYFKGIEILKKTVLPEKERRMVMLFIAYYNDCSYCQAAHKKGAKRAGVSEEEIRTWRDAKEISTERGKALSLATRLLLSKKGCLTQDNLKEIENRGIERRQLFEIIGIIGLQTISNYIDHISEIEIDEEFK
jgi:AhpD family alkylhydroperoxidase